MQEQETATIIASDEVESTQQTTAPSEPVGNRATLPSLRPVWLQIVTGGKIKRTVVICSMEQLMEALALYTQFHRQAHLVIPTTGEVIGGIGPDAVGHWKNWYDATKLVIVVPLDNRINIGYNDEVR